MITQTKPKATIEDLYSVDGKAEIVNGEVVLRPPTGDEPNRAAGSVYISLRQFEKQGGGRAYTDNAAFNVDLPNRSALSPDTSFYIGKGTGLKFLEGAPLFAVEVRSEGDYGRAAEKELAQKRADYFATGTLVVWDVDLLSEEVIKSYSATDPGNPKIFRRGEIADAEPALHGWRMPVDDLFS
jgi:Uma2 family endonuclease